MPRNKNELAHGLASRQKRAIDAVLAIPRDGARTLPLVKGLTQNCAALGSLENCLEEITDHLIASGRVYVYGNSTVMEITDREGRCLVPLEMDGNIERAAADRLGNILHFEYSSSGGPRIGLPSRAIVSAVLNREPTRNRLPRIRLYGNRPLFDRNFNLCGPGWHPDSGVLIHGVDIEPCIPDLGAIDKKAPALQRLPPRLRQVFQMFYLASDADVANALAAIVTGLMMPSFIEPSHPIFLLDGNKPGIGKSLLARTIGMIHDGFVPNMIEYSANDEELMKRIVATLRGRPQTSLIFDNAKKASGLVVSSDAIESQSQSGEIAIRIIGTPNNYRRPNDVQWFLTMNNTRVSPDIASRGVPIRAWHEGVINRRLDDNLFDTIKQHRREILGEVAGMVLAWKQRGCPRADKNHRCEMWARIVGGVLEVNGFPEFLTNVEQANAEFNTELDELAALAEAVVRAKKFHFRGGTATDTADKWASEILKNGAPPGKWEELFRNAELLLDRLGTGTSQISKSKSISNFFGRYIDRPIPVMVDGQEFTAVLRKAASHNARSTYYSFQVIGDAVTSASNAPSDTSAAPEESPVGEQQTPIKDVKTVLGGAIKGFRRPATTQSLAKPPAKTALVATTGNSEEWE